MNENPKILVVDDDSNIVHFIKTVLVRENYDVITAQSGIDALLLLEKEDHIDVMLLDVLMFGLDGFDVLELVKANPKTAKIKVIMLSGMNDVQDKVRAFSCGAVDYLSKPFEKAELIARLNTQVRVKRAEEEKQALLAKTETLYRVSRSLIGAANLSDLLQTVVNGVIEGLPANRVTLIGFDLTNKTVNHFVKGGIGQNWIKTVSFDELWQGLSGWVVRESKPALSLKTDPDPRESIVVQKRREETSCGSIIVVPLRYREQTIGTMTAINRPDERDFTELDVELMMAIANQAVVAIENARLFQALRQNEERTRLIIETAHQGIVTMDAEGIITGWNARAEHIFGWSLHEAIGRNLSTMIMPLTPQFSQNNFFYSPTPLIGIRPGDKPCEMIATHRTGRKCPVEVTLSPMKLDDTLAFSAFIHDISERKEAAEALRKAKDAAEAAAQAKTEFLANMSHEIRTPLNAIIGLSGLLLDTPLDKEQQEFIKITRTSGDTLLTIINDILDFSKIDAGKLELEEHPFSLSSGIEDALDLLTAKASEKGLEMAYFIDSQTPSQVVGDVARLRQVLVNLLSNAVKFTSEGEVIVSVNSQYLDNNRYQLHFAVRDTGIGIKQDQMTKLFHSFSQVDASTTRKYGGTGLGLVISKRLAEMMGGTMWVESEQGVGSTFHFTILVKAIKLPKQDEIQAHQPDLVGKRLLIVDDNETNRYILIRQLESWGMIAHALPSGAEALAWLKENPTVDLAILDMQMPEMDGLTLAKKIRQFGIMQGGGILNAQVEPQKSESCDISNTDQLLPLIMLTSLGWRADAETVAFSAYLTKPIKPSELYNLLLHIFSEHSTSITSHSTTHIGSSQFDPQMAQTHPLRILLAEDNAVNQKVALRLLQRMGYRADVAGNGLEVLAALHRQPYDVVLMDVQMPEMDGVETTQQIRRRRAEEKQPYVVAMTAHALKGDREYYLAAGMDDYVSKPVKVEELINVLQRCKPLNRSNTNNNTELADEFSESSSYTTIKQAPRSLSVKDEELAASLKIITAVKAAVRAMVGEENPEILAELIEIFLQDTEQQVTALQEAFTEENISEVRRVAHTLKGSSASLGFTALSTKCLELEEIIAGKKNEPLDEKVIEIEKEYRLIEMALALSQD